MLTVLAFLGILATAGSFIAGYEYQKNRPLGIVEALSRLKKPQPGWSFSVQAPSADVTALLLARLKRYPGEASSVTINGMSLAELQEHFKE